MGEPADAEKWGRSWSQDAERRDLPANNLYDSLRESNVIPAGEKLNGFVFLGTCSGSGVYEEMFAREMEKELQNIQAKPQPWKKPLIISSDYAYQYSPEGEKESPIPKIVGDTLTEELQEVDFQFLVSNAKMNPLPDHSVDVIFEHNGAMFYAGLTELREIMAEYERLLKSNGKIIVSELSLISLRERFGSKAEEILGRWKRTKVQRDWWSHTVFEHK